MGVKLLLAGRYEGHVAPRPWLRQAEGGLREVADELLESTRTVAAPRGPMLLLRLHPAADEVALVAAGEGRIWTDMVWRPPLLEEERHLFRDVARQLELAWREDPALAYAGAPSR